VSISRNGWRDIGDSQANVINDYYFGLKVYKWSNGNTNYIGLIINNYRYGWSEDYIDCGTSYVSRFYQNGFHIND